MIKMLSKLMFDRKKSRRPSFNLNKVMAVNRSERFNTLRTEINDLQTKYTEENYTIVLYDAMSQIIHLAGPGEHYLGTK